MTQQATRFIVQPGEGIKPVIDVILSATKSVQMVIFRCDFDAIETALAAAVLRGVFVHVIVAHQNSDDEACLRELELRLLACGATVARTDTDLLRYHNKMIIIDEEELFLLSFNYTLKDTHRSRSFGLLTRHRPWVEEAVKLFTADATRQPYSPGDSTFLVSPLNSREGLTTFIEGAQRQLLIYDKRVTDKGLVRILRRKQAEGVEIRVIGKPSRKLPDVLTRKLRTMRLHARVVIRDGDVAFLGSQSLRAAELDARREVGLIIEDPDVVSRLLEVFEQDWIEGDQPAPVAVPNGVVPEPPQIEEPVDAANGGAEAAVLPETVAVSADDLKDALKEVISSTLAEGNNLGLADMVKEAVKEAIQETLSSEMRQGSEGSEDDDHEESESSPARPH